MAVDPREAIASIPLWLRDRFGIQLNFGTPVVHVDHPALTVSDGRSWNADRIVICSGSDFEFLYPDSYQQLSVTRCKLQMTQTEAQPDGWRLGPLLAGGLTLQHYASFESCPSLTALSNRIQKETPEVNRYGIHVLAAQNNANEMILGDSHEYGDDISVFDKIEIDDIILRELKRLIRLPSFNITRRWHGVYAKLQDSLRFESDPQPGVKIMIAPGGAGMTMSFGLAERLWNNWCSPARNNELQI